MGCNKNHKKKTKETKDKIRYRKGEQRSGRDRWQKERDLRAVVVRIGASHLGDFIRLKIAVISSRK
jgi:hypothetical protein